MKSDWLNIDGNFKSFSGRITWIVVMTVLVIMTIISALVFALAASGIFVLTKDHFTGLTEKANGSIAMMMSNVEISADNIIDELSWHLTTPELVSETLEYELRTNNHLVGCGIGFIPDFFPEVGKWCEPYALVDGDDIISKSIGSEQHDYLSYEWFQGSINTPEGIWTRPYLDADGAGAILCSYTKQVSNPEGKVVGVFGADVSLDKLYSLLEEIDTEENQNFFYIPDETKDVPIYSFIIASEGEYIVHPDKERILKGTFFDYADPKDTLSFRTLGQAMCAGEKGEKKVVMDGVKSMVFYAPLQQSGWSMGVVVPMSYLLAPALGYGTLILFFILTGLIIIFLVCHGRIKKTALPLIKLAASAEEIAKGNFDVQLPDIRTKDEIRLLHDSFANMQESLSEYVQELTETTAQNASIENELSVARNIQMSMLPMNWTAFPESSELDIYGSLTPAKAVGGDLFDFIIRDGKILFCIGDVSGKGIPASLVMTVIGSMFRTLSDSENDPSKIMSSINVSTTARNKFTMFVTLFIGSLDLKTGELLYTNAGHNAPVIIKKGKPSFLKVDPNVPVGVEGDWKFTTQKAKLTPGSFLFLYTDGLTEATGKDYELFGEKRLLEHLSSLAEDECSAKDLVTRIGISVSSFVGDCEQSDDLTMLVVKMTGYAQEGIEGKEAKENS